LALAIVIIASIFVFNQKPKDIFLNVSDNVPARNESSNSTSGSGSISIPMAVSSGSYTYYDNFEEAEAIADLIFVGDVVKVNEPEEIKIGEITTDVYIVSEVRVQKVVDGNIKVGDRRKGKENKPLSLY
jgi:hypothetical protein